MEWSVTYPSIHSRSHWIANHIYRLMPNIDVLHINPGLFSFTYFLSLPIIANPTLVYKDLNISSRLDAVMFLIKMMLTPKLNAQSWEIERDHPNLNSQQMSFEDKAWIESAKKQDISLLERILT